jgi:micrococcal nuclease
MPRPFRRLLLLALVALVAQAASFTGRVVGITDGDTIRVLHSGRAERVRLWGIDCPELHQPFGTRARQFTSSAAFGKVVTVQVRDVDRYGRTVGEVILQDGRSLNRELVRAGLAWWYRQYTRDDRELQRLEAEARAARRGLWEDRNPVPPWQWRRKSRSSGRHVSRFLGYARIGQIKDGDALLLIGVRARNQSDARRCRARVMG